MQYTLFFIRTSKFCRGSSFLIFWLLQPQFVLNLFLFPWAALNDDKSNKKNKESKKNADRLYYKEIVVHLSKSKTTNQCVFCPLSQSSPTGCRGQFFCCPTILQDSLKFQQEPFLLFLQPQPELVFKLFLIFGQPEPHCSHKVAIFNKKGPTIGPTDMACSNCFESWTCFSLFFPSYF